MNIEIANCLVEFMTEKERQEMDAADAAKQEDVGDNFREAESGSKENIGTADESNIETENRQSDEDEVHIDKNGIYVNDEDMKEHIFKHHKPDFLDFPLGLLALISYIAIGCMYNLWHPAWVLFLTIPLYYEMISFFRRRK